MHEWLIASFLMSKVDQHWNALICPAVGKVTANVTYENLQGQKPHKTELEDLGSLPNSWDTSVSAMPLCNGYNLV